jgi:hypothetical protein
VIYRAASAVLVSVCICSSLLAQNPKKSTQEERKQWADALHKLEAQPGDADTLKVALHAMDRLVEVDDVTISPCAFKELPENYKPFKPILFYTLALSAYQVETGKDDAIGSNVYGIRSALKAYNSELAINPKAHDKKLDRLIKLDADGQLEALVVKDGCNN